jgi:hypothetical protein
MTTTTPPAPPPQPPEPPQIKVTVQAPSTQEAGWVKWHSFATILVSVAIAGATIAYVWISSRTLDQISKQTTQNENQLTTMQRQVREMQIADSLTGEALKRQDAGLAYAQKGLQNAQATFQEQQRYNQKMSRPYLYIPLEGITRTLDSTGRMVMLQYKVKNTGPVPALTVRQSLVLSPGPLDADTVRSWVVQIQKGAFTMVNPGQEIGNAFNAKYIKGSKGNWFPLEYLLANNYCLIYLVYEDAGKREYALLLHARLVVQKDGLDITNCWQFPKP